MLANFKSQTPTTK